MKKRFYVIIPVVLLLAGLVFSGERTNPPVERQIAWDSPETQRMFYRSCADCHSHETRWPWYSWIAPISWRVIGHVNDGRRHFNISSPETGDSDEAAGMVRKGEMPLRDYLWLHPEAKLSPEERTGFVLGLKATFGDEAERESPGEDHSDHDHRDDD